MMTRCTLATQQKHKRKWKNSPRLHPRHFKIVIKRKIPVSCSRLWQRQTTAHRHYVKLISWKRAYIRAHTAITTHPSAAMHTQSNRHIVIKCRNKCHSYGNSSNITSYLVQKCRSQSQRSYTNTHANIVHVERRANGTLPWKDVYEKSIR